MFYKPTPINQLFMLEIFFLSLLLVILERVNSYVPTTRYLNILSSIERFPSFLLPKGLQYKISLRSECSLSSSSHPYPALNPSSSKATSSFSSSASLSLQDTKLSTITQSRTAAEAVNAVKLLAEQRNNVLTQQEIEKIPQLLLHFLNLEENDVKDRYMKENENIKRKYFLSSYLLADCAWSAGTLQNRKLDNSLATEVGIQPNLATSRYKNKNDYYLTELAIKIITNLVLQNDNVKGRDLAKTMIGFQRMGVEWENISPNDMTLILESNMNNLDGRGLSNVIWSLGSLYVRFDELSLILKVSVMMANEGEVLRGFGLFSFFDRLSHRIIFR